MTNKVCSTHRIVSIALLSGVTLLGGCYQGLMMKRKQEIQCPTDIRQKVPWCAGEDALFHGPCGPDSDFYGMKPTCWGEWPASGADWRNAFCGSPAECYPLPLGATVPGKVAPGEMAGEVPLAPEPVAAEQDGFYNPFAASRQTPPMPPSTVEPDHAPPGQSDSQAPAQLPTGIPGAEAAPAPKVAPETVTPGAEVRPEKQGVLFPLPNTHAASNPGRALPRLDRQLSPGNLVAGAKSRVERQAVGEVPSSPAVLKQASRIQVSIPPAPVAAQPEELVLAKLQLKARKAVLDWGQEVAPRKVAVKPAPSQRAADHESSQIRLLEHLGRRGQSSLYTK